MRNLEQWKPSKYVLKGDSLRASRDQSEVGVGSRLISDIVAEYYWENIKEYCRGKLLDLGCGKVPLYEAYREYIENSICVDWGNSIHGNDYIDVIADLSQPIPLSSELFDTIILSDVLEHVPQPENLWGELYRLLNNNGKVLINVPFLYWIHEQPYDYYRFTEFALRRYSEHAGFRVLLLTPIGGAPEVVTDILSKLMARLPIVGKGLSSITQSACKVFLSTNLGSGISKKSSAFFPLGYFMVVEKQ